MALARRLAILGYHKIGEPPADGWETWNYVPEEIFVGHLDHLRRRGWELIDLDAFLAGLADPDRLPPRAALLTFDDGYRSMRSVALPHLRRFDAPAVLFAIADLVGGRSTAFDGDDEPDEPLCDWDDLRALEAAGVAVQSHGATHRSFADLRPSEREAEVATSKAVLEAGLGRPVDVFAYPYGDEGGDPALMRDVLRRAGYRAACLYGGGPLQPPVDEPYRLTRLAIGPDTDLDAELGA